MTCGAPVNAFPPVHVPRGGASGGLIPPMPLCGRRQWSGPSGTRTHDTRFRRPVLCPLSYGPITPLNHQDTGTVTPTDPTMPRYEPDDVSYGLTSEEHQRLLDLPNEVWLEFINHFTNIYEPLRIQNVSGYIESLGLSSPMHLTSFVGTLVNDTKWKRPPSVSIVTSKEAHSKI